MNLTRLRSPRIPAGLVGMAVVPAVGLAPGIAIADEEGPEAVKQESLAKAKAKARGKAPDLAATRARASAPMVRQEDQDAGPVVRPRGQRRRHHGAHLEALT